MIKLKQGTLYYVLSTLKENAGDNNYKSYSLKQVAISAKVDAVEMLKSTGNNEMCSTKYTEQLFSEYCLSIK